MTSASVMRRKPARERTAWTCAAVLTAFLLATLTVGCGWLGGPSRITDNRRILNSLPMPAGVGQISIDSHYHTQGDSLLAPPDGWMHNPGDLPNSSRAFEGGNRGFLPVATFTGMDSVRGHRQRL